MDIEIRVPRLGWSMEEGTFSAWLKADGQHVKAGEALFALENEKALQEVESLDSGTLRIPADAPRPGDIVRIGQVLGYLASESEAAVPGGASGGGAAPESVAAEMNPTGQVPSGESDPVPSLLPRVISDGESAASMSGTFRPAASRPKTISPRALRVAAELGVDWTQVVGTGRTGRIREQDIRAAADDGRGHPEVGSDAYQP